MNLTNEEKEMEWISVKDRLPEKYNTVLCFMPSYGQPVVPLMLTDSNDWMSTSFDVYASRIVTHWMRLPPPPNS